MDQAAVHADRAKIAELLDHIQRQELTVEEAAKSLAGFRLKAIHTAFPARTAYNHEEVYRSCLVDLESRLPGWQGLSLQRHFGVQD